MPYKDREKRRAAQRDAQRRKRAGARTLKVQPRVNPELVELRLATAQDAVAALREEMRRVVTLCNGEESGAVLARARTVAGLLVTFLRAVEVSEILPRLEALEAEAECRGGFRGAGGAA